MAEKDLSFKMGVKKFDGNSIDFRVWKISLINALKADKSSVACENSFDLEEEGK